MKPFSFLYDKAMRWSQNRYAVWYLGMLSFAESSFFPVPPDVMLAPMALAQTARAWRYAAIATIASVVGGLFGYAIGYLAFDAIEPLVRNLGYWPQFERVREWFVEYGVWAILIAGFSPVPYKIFTISAGVAGMSVLPFVAASAVGRGARFFLVAGLMVWGGARMEGIFRKYIDIAGWVVVGLAVLWLVMR